MNIPKLLNWSEQLLPPLLLVLTFSTHGPGLWFLLWIPALAFLISTISLTIKLFNFEKQKNNIVRPLLTLIISLFLLGTAIISFNIAKSETMEIANNLKKQCESNGLCPNPIADWETPSNIGDCRTKVGSFITYPLFYTYNENKFSLYLYQSLDLGKSYIGGIDTEIELVR